MIRIIAYIATLTPSTLSLTPQLLHKINHADDEDATEGKRDDCS